MKRYTLILLSLLFITIAKAQDKNTLILINDEPVTVDEFKRVYEKNNPDAEYSDSAISEYLDLYINFKLKVAEAKSQGYDTLESFITELDGYRDQLAKPYFKNEAIEEQILQEAYDRLKTEIDVSHILIKMDANPSPEDTLKAYNRAMEAYNAIKNKDLSFEEAVAKYTDDERGVAFDGSIGFIRAFVTVYEFEDAAYNAAFGEVTKPVRTSYGYHLILKRAEQPSRGELKISHIFIKSDEQMDDEAKEKAKQKVDEVYQYLLDGQEFEAIAKEYSEDSYTAERGGEIGWFSAGRMIPQIANTANALKVDTFSMPVQSPYGYHIIKLLDEKPVQPLEDIKASLESKIKKGARNNKPEQIVLAQLKKENNFSENKTTVDATIKALMLGIAKHQYDSLDNIKPTEILFTIDDQPYLQSDFIEYLSEQKKKKAAEDAIQYLIDNYQNFVSKSLKDFEDSHLEEKYPEFRHLIDEYHDGILLFNIMEEKVWNYAAEDTAGLDAFFMQNRDKYVWDTRAEVAILEYTDSLLSEKLIAELNVIKNNTLDIEDLNSKLCGNDSIPCIAMKTKKVEQGDDARIDDIPWFEGEFSTPVLTGDKFQVFRINQLLDPAHKELAECRGIVIADYQTKLEKDWLEELKQSYDVRINAKLLKKLKKGKI